MLKFYFPKDIAICRPFVSEEILNKDLIMVAEEEGKLKALCSFYYSKTQSVVHHLISLEDDPDLLLLDGLFRTVMYHLMEMDCTRVVIESVPEKMMPYFNHLGFEKISGGWASDHFSELLFSGCQSCKEKI